MNLGGLFTLPLFLHICNGALLPVPKCKISDTKCLKASAQAAVPLLAPGIPEIGAPPLDIMHIDLIKVNLAGLNMVVKDAVLKGLKNAKIDKISMDMAKKELKIVFSVDAEMKGKYKASGQLLILPISGDGDLMMKIKNAELNVTNTFEVVKNADGKDVIKLKGFRFTYDIKDGASYYLTNLFNGNKELSNTLLKFSNENWKLLSEEFGEPILRACIKVIFTSIKKYLYAHPLEELTEL
ncbi:unnamed protein product [Chilo suppressalis]|uniref:Uncharacterized protein n=1 Tax=Chilo suppressalis TaxID=168631 RepID=A0ABN8AUM3_CHISP|nr:hypothetical protein evm_000747 [Chilo suppressalis]CAH0399756.1 unnamed protein product [Chilo suppressalis]